MGSIDSEVPLALQNTYAATKAAVLSLGKSLNEELRLSGHGDDIQVAAIMPWAIDTPWWTHAANYTGHNPRMTAMDDPALVVDKIVEACTEPQEKMPVGLKAHASNLSHQILPDLTERLTATVAARESEKGAAAADTSGPCSSPCTKVERSTEASASGWSARTSGSEPRPTAASNVMAFYNLMFNECRAAEAIERYADETYTPRCPKVPAPSSSKEWAPPVERSPRLPSPPSTAEPSSPPPASSSSTAP